MAEPSSCGVTVAGSNAPTISPRKITWIESDKPISSSRSAEISSTARPSCRARLMCSQMAACAPTSTPRVGWERHQQLGRTAHLAPMPTAFRWLPPDRARARTSMLGVRTSYSSTMRWASACAPADRSGGRRRWARGSVGRGSGSPTGPFGAGDRDDDGPSGTEPMPDSGAELQPRVERPAMLEPTDGDAAAAMARTPMTASTSLDSPLPSTPATPRNSRARTADQTSDSS